MSLRSAVQAPFFYLAVKNPNVRLDYQGLGLFYALNMAANIIIYKYIRVKNKSLEHNKALNSTHYLNVALSFNFDP